MNKQTEQVQEMGLLISKFQNGTYFFNKGIEAYREKDLRKAKRYLERAIQLEPLEPGFLCQLAIILADLGEYHRSNDCLNNIIDNKLDEEMYECHFFLANNYANLGLFEHAKKEALRYIDNDPDGEFLEEVEDLLEVLQEEDDLFAEEENFLIRYELASHELKKQNYERAIIFFKELIEEEPSFWMARVRLAESYFESGNRKKAIEILESVVEKEDNVTARCHLMTSYFEVGQKEDAFEILDTLKNVWPIDNDQSYLLAVSLGKLGEHNLAYECFERLQKRGFGDFPKFFYHVAIASFYTKRLERATSILEKLADLGVDVAKTNLELLQKGELIAPSYNYSQNTHES